MKNKNAPIKRSSFVMTGGQVATLIILSSLSCLILGLVGGFLLRDYFRPSQISLAPETSFSIYTPLPTDIPPTDTPAPTSEMPPTWTPKPTNTTLPTRTPRPTNTPAPTNPPQQGTFSNPVPIGTGYQFSGHGTMTIEETLWKSGQTGLAIVYISFVCERPSDQICDTSRLMFSVVGDSGSGYNQEFDSSIPDPDFGSIFTPDVYGGGTEKGYAGFLITQQETSLIMKVGMFLQDEEIFFSISE